MVEAVRDVPFAEIGVPRRSDAARLVPMYGVVLALHVVGFGLIVHHGGQPRESRRSRSRRS